MIGSETIERALCDLGSSVSLLPLSLFKKFGLGELKPTGITLQLADRSIVHPAGIVEDIPIKVGDIYIPADFVVMDMEEDYQVPLLLGRPFLATAGTMIDVKHGKLAFNVGKEKVEFEIGKIMKNPSILDTCYMFDTVDHCVKDHTTCNGLRDPH